jgi:hypothetical protein
MNNVIHCAQKSEKRAMKREQQLAKQSVDIERLQQVTQILLKVKEDKEKDERLKQDEQIAKQSVDIDRLQDTVYQILGTVFDQETDFDQIFGYYNYLLYGRFHTEGWLYRERTQQEIEANVETSWRTLSLEEQRRSSLDSDSDSDSDSSNTQSSMPALEDPQVIPCHITSTCLNPNTTCFDSESDDTSYGIRNSDSEN